MLARSNALRVAVAAAALALASATALATVSQSTGDVDRDGIADTADNCPKAFNPDQEDFDDDGLGNTCDDTPGVAPNDSWLVVYVRDEQGRPLPEGCFSVQSDIDVDPFEFCVEPDEPGYIETSITTPETMETITQTTRPRGCSGGLAAPIVHQFESGGWKAVEVRYRCASAPTKVFSDTFSKPGDTKEHAVQVPKRTKTVEVVIRWKNKRDRFQARQFRIVRGKIVVARGTASHVKLKPGKLKITHTQTATSETVRITKLKPGNLRFDVAATRVTRKARVTTRVSQSKR